ncbi:MAG: GYF domain-containing protein [Polyangiaceae bacterium]
MKFLCEQCKAKYQISDDKVAGKTVRMKCRKCGHMIEVRAEVTESSVAKSLPPEDGKKPPKPAAKGGLATSLTARPPAAPKAPKPDALAGAFQKRVTAEPAESTASLEILDSSAASGWYVAINGVPVGPIRVSELRRKAANGAVNEDSLVWREGLEEWRPVRSVTEIAELVREAMTSGRPPLVTPLPPHRRRRTSEPAPPPPTAAAPAAAPRPPARPASSRARATARGPRGAQQRRSTGRLATAEKVEEDEDIDIEEAEPSSKPGALLRSPPRQRAASRGTGAVRAAAVRRARRSRRQTRCSRLSAPPAVAAASAAAASCRVGGPADDARAARGRVYCGKPAGRHHQQRRQTRIRSSSGWCLRSAAFGVTAAVFIFKKDPQPQQPQIIVVPQPQAQPGIATAQPTAAVTDTPSAPASSDKPASGGGTKIAAKPTGPTPPATAPKTGGNTLGLDPSLIGGNGPNVGPGGTGGGSTSSGGHRSEDSIQQTVRNYSLGVRRTCWERSGVQTPSVNINAKISIATSGQVNSVEASGNEPVVAKCIEEQVKKWNFGPGDTVTVNIPFKFIRQ